MAKLTVSQFADLLAALDGIDADVHIHVAVNCDVGAADAVMDTVLPADEVATPADTPAAPPLSAADFPVGARIRWCGRQFRGDGTVAKHNDDGSISVRIHDLNSNSDKRVNLNADDIAGGGLTLR